MRLILDRRTLLLSSFAVAALPSTLPARSTPLPPKILLVCKFGTVKSPMARELLKWRAAQRGIALSARSRGITPGQHLSPELRDRLVAEGIVIDTEPLVTLSGADVRWADLVIAFDALPSSFQPRAVRDWSSVPSMLNDYPRARPDLDRRIDQLLDDLASGR